MSDHEKRSGRQLSFDFSGADELERLRSENRLLKAEIDRLRQDYHRLRIENDRLRSQYADFSNAVYTGEFKPIQHTSEPSPSLPRTVTKHSSADEKVKLFRQFFKGRDDVYAVRSADRQGKVAYYPKRQYLGKVDGKHVWGDYLPLTDEVIKSHLFDEVHPVTVGLYPLLLDETCWFLAIDFDKSEWKEDAAAFLDTCRAYGVPAALERSRSGNGGHVWIFFEAPVTASLARTMGTALLTLTLEKRNRIGLDSYDRMFPNQDTLPRDKKLGNLIALPLQRLAGKEGNSLFIDDDFKSYSDQWVFLSALKKMKPSEVEELVQEARRKGYVLRVAGPFTGEDDGESGEPWEAESENQDESAEKFPSPLRAVIRDMLYIEKKGLTSSQLNRLVRLAAFQNPEFYRAQKMRLPVWGKPRIIDCSEDLPQHLALPRGCLDEVRELLRRHQAVLQLEDKRNAGREIHVRFRGELRERQKEAVRELEKYDTGVLSATTAFGKTVVGIWMIAARKTNTLILVHRAQLMDQWKNSLSAFLDIPPGVIGQIGGGKNKRTGIIDIAMLQTVHGRGEVKPFIAEYGHIVVDECHHVSAFSFEQVLKKATAKYVLGLTATLTRKDGHHPIVTMQCGPIRYRIDARSEAKDRPFRHVVIPRYTSFGLLEPDHDAPIHELYERITEDEQRNDLIFDDLLKALEQGRSPILLTERTAHLEYFERRLQGFAKNIIVLRGGMGKKQRDEIQEKIRLIPDDQERVLLATGKFAGEGFDDARLDTLFLVMPISWKGTLQQYAGRLHRLHDAKREVRIYDYVDALVPKLRRMYDKRVKGYAAMGYTFENGGDHDDKP